MVDREFEVWEAGVITAIGDIPIDRLKTICDAEREGRLEIITTEQKKARDYLANYSREDREFDDEYC